MQVFVPVEDAGLDFESGRLVPYRAGLVCAHQLRGGLVLRDGVWTDPVLLGPQLISPTLTNAGSSSRRPESVPACAPGRH
jgi:hypothetical protein